MFSLVFNFSSVKAEKLSYARILNNNTYLYSSSDLTEDNKFFMLEKTYFVKILSMEANCYKVKYFNITGYVDISEVEIVNGIPNKPYPENITFNINSYLNTKIRTTPTMKNDDNIIGYLPNSNCKLNYLATTEGEESIKNMGTKWYYCNCSYDNNSIIYGFVYAPLTENLTKIMPNTETFEEIEEISQTEIPQDITERQNIVLVVLLCMPAIVIVVLLVIPLNKKNTKKTKKKLVKKNIKKSNKDYYEID